VQYGTVHSSWRRVGTGLRLRRITLRTGDATPSCSNRRFRPLRDDLTVTQVRNDERKMIEEVRFLVVSRACCVIRQLEGWRERCGAVREEWLVRDPGSPRPAVLRRAPGAARLSPAPSAGFMPGRSAQAGPRRRPHLPAERVGSGSGRERVGQPRRAGGSARPAGQEAERGPGSRAEAGARAGLPEAPGPATGPRGRGANGSRARTRGCGSTGRRPGSRTRPSAGKRRGGGPAVGSAAAAVHGHGRRRTAGHRAHAGRGRDADLGRLAGRAVVA
jgi:hypothetical protein